jgi:hypothetical protein
MPEQNPDQTYYIGDAIKKTAVHHNSYKDLWESKWKFPVRYAHYRASAAHFTGCSRESLALLLLLPLPSTFLLHTNNHNPKPLQRALLLHISP